MKIYMALVGIIIFSVLVSAVSVDISCPKSVELNEEFVCNLEISDSSGPYDLKAVIEKDGSSSAKLWNPFESKWKSSYYYIKEFIDGDGTKEIRIKIEKEGKYSSNFKLRKGSTINTFNFSITVGSYGPINESKEEEESNDEGSNETDWIEERKLDPIEEQGEETRIVKNKETINLNEPSQDSSCELIYSSKNIDIVEYAPYVFSLFLIVIIGFLIREKF